MISYLIGPETKGRVDISPTRKKDWVLTQAAFDRLLARLGTEREEAGRRYEELRLRVVKFFEWKNAPAPEEHADEVINRVARKIEEGEEVRNVFGYALEVARFLMLEIWRQPDVEQEPEEGFGEQSSVPAPEMEPDLQEQRLLCLERCMDSLTEEKRAIIKGFYEGEKREKIDNRKAREEVRANTERSKDSRLPHQDRAGKVHQPVCRKGKGVKRIGEMRT
ncbi:MAG: hypothetical protein M3362_13735 [Acidobacteriota bacterium]|nr:hypothetical protein [Acidobacteriota bacterium]